MNSRERSAYARIISRPPVKNYVHQPAHHTSSPTPIENHVGAEFIRRLHGALTPPRLEQEPQRELHFTLAAACNSVGADGAGDRAERGRRAEIARRLVEVRRVSQIVEFRAEFYALALGDPEMF